MILDAIGPRDYYTITQLYTIVEIGENTLYRAIHTKKLDAFRKCGTGPWLILGADFIAWYTNGHERYSKRNPHQVPPNTA